LDQTTAEVSPVACPEYKGHALTTCDKKMFCDIKQAVITYPLQASK
jgi:hypothetical protein